MGTLEFPDLGQHCSVDSCRINDFLPFTCDRCRQVYCLEHRGYASHKCKHAALGDATVIVCPLCNTSVRLLPNEDPNDTWHRHVSKGCNPANGERLNQKRRCPMEGCKEHLTFSNTVRCKDCAKEVCLRHRFGPDHACPGPASAAPPSLWATGSAYGEMLLQNVQGSMSSLMGGSSSSSTSASSAAAVGGRGRGSGTRGGRSGGGGNGGNGRGGRGSGAVIPTHAAAGAAAGRQQQQQQQQQQGGAVLPWAWGDRGRLTSSSAGQSRATAAPATAAATPSTAREPTNTLRGSDHRRMAPAAGALSQSQQMGGTGATPAAASAAAEMPLRHAPGGVEECPICREHFPSAVALVAHAEASHPAGVVYGTGGVPATEMRHQQTGRETASGGVAVGRERDGRSGAGLGRRAPGGGSGGAAGARGAGGTGPEVCPQCGKRFQDAVSLVEHVQCVHEGGGRGSKADNCSIS